MGFLVPCIVAVLFFRVEAISVPVAALDDAAVPAGDVSGDVGRSRAPLAHLAHPLLDSPRFVPDPACLQANLREPGTEEASQGRF